MKKAFLKSTLFIVISFIIACLNIIPGINRGTIGKYYFLDYAGIFFVLTAQSLLKEKDKTSFILYIIGLVLNGLMGYVMGSLSIILFSVYSTFIFIDNWKQWNKDEKKLKTASQT